MGFIKANTIPLLREAKRKAFSGNVLFLGYPDIYFDYGHFQRMAEGVGVTLNKSVPIQLSHKPDFATKGYLSGETVFKMLGFDNISVLDCSGFEGADMIFNLNESNLPEDWMGKYDTVIDHGTLEHIFHLPNALNNIFKLLKVGGRAFTSSPSSNFFDHGFYMFQPTLFLDFYTANQWKIHSIQVVQFSANQEDESEPCFFEDYVPGKYDAVGYGKMDVNQKLFLTACVVSKESRSRGDQIPEQGYYRRLNDWKSSTPIISTKRNVKNHPLSSLFVNVKHFLKRFTNAH